MAAAALSFATKEKMPPSELIVNLFMTRMTCVIAASPRADFHKALKETGDAYTDIGLLFEEQPKLDWEPLGDLLHLYKGIITSFPDILSAHKVS